MAQKEHVLITGATGFIGKALIADLLEQGYRITVTSRNPEKAEKLLDEHVRVVEWDAKSAHALEPLMNDVQVVINLAGENLAGGKWDERRKGRILQSRKDTGKAISEAIAAARNKPHTLLQASATGYYGYSEDAVFTENHEPGEGFLAEVAQAWEGATRSVEILGVRRVLLRSGVVLGHEGALPKMALPVRLFAGVIPGSGKQWISWIHIRDEVRAIRFLLESKQAIGIYNLTAPNPKRMKTFMKTLARVLKRPVWFRIPDGPIRMLMGEMAEATVLKGQYVIPHRLSEAGFTFSFPDLETALRNLYQKS